ncbi:MAG: hypothetical protein U9O94_06985 [Nanoarchaeota archaeon]|nr:hypothetical protein [Nanoarchaeota archaeon]
MKPFNELTTDEQIDIIHFMSGTMPMYYSKITQLSPDSLEYNDKTYTLSKSQYDIIVNGLNIYEVYKLQMTASEADSILRTASEKSFESLYSDKFDKLISAFNSAIDVASDTIRTTTTSSRIKG